jgi:hypothetical protein
MRLDLAELADSLAEVFRLARIDLPLCDIKTELIPAPHRRPRSLPPGTQAVYAFILGERCLKVGKAGPKTQARFTSQHYGMNAPSTLAKSILNDRSRVLDSVSADHRGEVQSLNIDSIGNWLEKSTSRVHIFIPATAPDCALALAETFIQCRLRPVYEGKGLQNAG